MCEPWLLKSSDTGLAQYTNDIIDWNGLTGEIEGYQFPDPEIQIRDFIKKPYNEIKK